MPETSGVLIDTLTRFHSYVTALHRETKLSSLLNALVMRAVQLIKPASACCFVAYDEKNDAFAIRYSHGYSFSKIIEAIAFSDEESVFYEVIRQNAPQKLVSSTSNEIPWLPAICWSHYQEGSDGLTPSESIVMALNDTRKAIGVLVIEHFHDNHFSPMDVQLVATFARQSTLAIHKVELYQENLQINQELEQELQSVGDVQKRLLPVTFPFSEYYDYFTYYCPSTRAGGDYYDFIPLEDGRLVILIGDVSGHGAGAAVIVAMTKMIIHNLLAHTCDPIQILSEANEQIRKHISLPHYITLFLGILEPSSSTMVFSSAGHIPPLMLRGKTGELKELWNDRGFPLRMVDENSFDLKSTRFEQEDVLILYTDGITEMFGENQEVYSFDSFYKVVQSATSSSATEFGQSILQKLEEFRGSTPLHDDVTLIIIKCK